MTDRPARACAQSWGRAVIVPGRALAGVVELLRGQSGLPPDAHQLLVDFHADVVQLLTSEGAGRCFDKLYLLCILLLSCLWSTRLAQQRFFWTDSV